MIEITIMVFFLSFVIAPLIGLFCYDSNNGVVGNYYSCFLRGHYVLTAIALGVTAVNIAANILTLCFEHVFMDGPTIIETLKGVYYE
jgi:hypothetical protein